MGPLERERISMFRLIITAQDIQDIILRKTQGFPPEKVKLRFLTNSPNHTDDFQKKSDTTGVTATPIWDRTISLSGLYPIDTSHECAKYKNVHGVYNKEKLKRRKCLSIFQQGIH